MSFIISLVVNISWSFPHSWRITGLVIKLTRRVPLVEQELPTLPKKMSSPPVFSGARVTRSLALCSCSVDRSCPFSFCHCVVCSCSIYGFWLPPFGIFKLFLPLLYAFKYASEELYHFLGPSSITFLCQVCVYLITISVVNTKHIKVKEHRFYCCFKHDPPPPTHTHAS